MLSETELVRRRRDMIDRQIKARGVRDPRVLDALAGTPRERFVPDHLIASAYEDRALAIGDEQTISQPCVVALMTDLLQVGPSGTILEIGTGSGYQTAILCQLAERVVTIERISSLSEGARSTLAGLHLDNVVFRIGDGSQGCDELGPYDGIMITAAAPGIIGRMIQQLKIGGRLIVPVGDESQQTLTTIVRCRAGWTETPGIPVRFVKLIGREGFEA